MSATIAPEDRVNMSLDDLIKVQRKTSEETKKKSKRPSKKPATGNTPKKTNNGVSLINI